MGTLFDTLADITLGLRPTATPITPSLFAPDGVAADGEPAPWGDLEVEVEGIAPRPSRRRTPAVSSEPAIAEERQQPPAQSSPRPARPDDTTPSPLATRATARRDADEPRRRRSVLPVRLVPVDVPVAIPGVASAATHRPDSDTARRAPAALSDAAGGDSRDASGGAGEDAADASPSEPPAPRQESPSPRRPKARTPATATPARQAREAAPDTRDGGESIVRITIGRIDVRAVAPREPAPRPSAPRPNTGPALGEYLRDRGDRGAGGGR